MAHITKGQFKCGVLFFKYQELCLRTLEEMEICETVFSNLNLECYLIGK